ncbi:uncharacterized protein LOC133799926 [Humulus lupulus]|uniref:uncharacterized protein LOC133799926 n=1 Tax=Humulus lupulus TaxID=3486 RepID=UPI002B4078FC|nr:uncharacterized protein LOC133799926 [Humulus lupulus]
MGKKGLKYVTVAVDYFTKWVEAEPLPTITSKKALEFVIKNIFFYYELPRKIVSYNSLHFDSEVIVDFYQRHTVLKGFSSMAHQQENVQVEGVNKTLKATMKKRLEQEKGTSPEELPKELWSYRTTARTSTSHSLWLMESLDLVEELRESSQTFEL